MEQLDHKGQVCAWGAILYVQTSDTAEHVGGDIASFLRFSPPGTSLAAERNKARGEGYLLLLAAVACVATC